MLTGEVDTSTSYYADEMNLVKVGGHSQVNALVNYDWKRTDKNVWSIFARVDNLFDEEFYTTARASGDSDGNRRFDNQDISITVNPGMVWTVGITVTF